jgi:tetratricopeptide (TPR) repeat protein
MTVRYAAALLVAALVWGCTSAKDVYRDAMDLEVSGDYAGAADRYARALERDPALENVPGRLAVAGREAVRRLLAAAGAADAVGAADAYLAADHVVRRAAAVGVDVERPARFEAGRDAALDAAVADLLRQSDGRADLGDWPGALGALDRARAYRPTPERRAALDRAARDAWAGWAEADFHAGRYRSAYVRTGRALALAPPDDPDADRLLALRDAVLDAGTVVAVLLPADGAGEGAPPRLARDLDDAVEDALFAVPRPFLAFVAPAESRRALPRRRSVRWVDSPRRAAGAARDLGADLAVAVGAGPVVAVETVGEEREERVRFRRGTRDVAVRRRTDRVALDGTAAFAVVDAGGRVVCDGEVEAEAETRFDVGLYDGDVDALDLPRAERAAFRPDVADVAFDEALLDLAGRLADALGARVVRCLEAQVP